MFCSNCGAKLSENQSTCTNCGLSVQQGQKKVPFWIKALFFIFIAIVAYFIWAVSYGQSIASVVEDQINDIHNQKITQAYYDYSSKEFQKATSLDQFKEFLKNQAVFSEKTSFHIDDQTIAGSIVTIKGTFLQNEKSLAKAEYQLIEENEKWKLLNIQIFPIKAEKNLPDNETQKVLLSVVSKQLEALRKNDFDVAYDQLVTEDFKTATPLDAFKNFVNSHPILSEKSNLKLQNANLEPNQEATVDVVLESQNENVPVEFLLRKEDNHWKIVGLKLTENGS